MCRLRTIPKALEYIKEQDPKSDISEFFIRKLAKSGQISTAQSGSKIYVDVDVLIAYLSGEKITPTTIYVD